MMPILMELIRHLLSPLVWMEITHLVYGASRNIHIRVGSNLTLMGLLGTEKLREEELSGMIKALCLLVFWLWFEQ